MSGGEKNRHGSLVIVSKRGIHFAQTFCFPKLLVRIWVTLAREFMTYIAIAMHEMLCICSRRDCTFSMWHSSIANVGAPLWVIICLFPAILDGVHPSLNSFIWRSMCPWTFLQGHVTLLEHFYLTKHEIFFNVLTSICKKLACSPSPSIAKQEVTSQRQCTFMKTVIVPPVPHQWFEFSQIKHCTMLPPYTKLLKWPMYMFLHHICLHMLLLCVGLLTVGPAFLYKLVVTYWCC